MILPAVTAFASAWSCDQMLLIVTVMAFATLLLQDTVESSGRVRSFRSALWRHICVIACANLVVVC
jgi:hypothetical protein